MIGLSNDTLGALDELK